MGKKNTPYDMDDFEDLFEEGEYDDFDDDDDFDEEGDYDDDDVFDDDADIDEQGAPAPAVKLNKKTLGKLQNAVKGKKKLGPRARRLLRKARRMDRLVNNRSMSYISVKGGTLLSCSLGMDSRLRPAECVALKSAIFASAAYEPLDIVMDPLTGIIDVGAAAGGNYQGGLFSGFFLRAQASNLNIVPGGTFDVQVFNYGFETPEFTATFRIDKGFSVFQASMVTARQVAGKPRYSARPIQDNALVPPLTNSSRVVLSGYDANYNYKARLMLPGDADTENLLRLL